MLWHVLENALFEVFPELHGTFRDLMAAICIIRNMLRTAARSPGMAQPINRSTIFIICQRASEKPKLRVNAAEARHVLPLVQQSLQNCEGSASHRARVRLQCVE